MGTTVCHWLEIRKRFTAMLGYVFQRDAKKTDACSGKTKCNRSKWDSNLINKLTSAHWRMRSNDK